MMSLIGRGTIVIALRDLQRFWKYRWWLAGLISMNLTDLFIFALIFNNIVNRSYIPDYFRFIAPGIAAIAIFASAFSIGREVGVEVRRQYTQYLLTLPITRLQLAAGRIIGGSVRGLIYQIPFIALLFIIEGVPPSWKIPYLLATSVLLTIAMSGLSITISTAVRSFDLQATMRSFTYFLLFFFSNVFYPDKLIREYLPYPLYQLMVNNPVSLAAGVYRWVFTDNLFVDIDPQLSIIKIAVISVVITLIGGKLYLRNLTS